VALHATSDRSVGRFVRAGPRPTLAVWKFASCDGCQLTLLDCEDDLLAVAGQVDIAYFLEASSATVDGPYDVSLVEGSITTAHDAERIRAIRARSGKLVVIGACATAGGIQALRNFAGADGGPDASVYATSIYAHPEALEALPLATSTPVSEHVFVDFELRGCPIDKRQLLEVVSATLAGRKPQVPAYAVCLECKRRGVPCVLVAGGQPCLGPATQAGCGALCPSFGRGCYGCFGPMEGPNLPALAERFADLGVDADGWLRALRTYNAYAGPFRKEAERALRHRS
jgi:coenzyme F420-reducing hydrogenase gamma subunit